MRRGGAVSWVPSRRLLPCRAFVTDLCGVNAAGQQTRCVCIRDDESDGQSLCGRKSYSKPCHVVKTGRHKPPKLLGMAGNHTAYIFMLMTGGWCRWHCGKTT